MKVKLGKIGAGLAAGMLLAGGVLSPRVYHSQPVTRPVPTSRAAGATKIAAFKRMTEGQREILCSTLQENRTLWTNKNASHYTYTYTTKCRCVNMTILAVEVKDNTIVSAYSVPLDSKPSEAPTNCLNNGCPVSSIDEVFDQALEAIDANDLEKVSYDSDLGFPTVLDSDPNIRTIDDESRVVVSEFTVLV